MDKPTRNLIIFFSVAFGIVALVMIGVAATMFLSTSESGPEYKRLNGRVTFDGYTFHVSNDGMAWDWTEVELRIDSKWRMNVPMIRHGDGVEVRALDFVDSEGLRFNPLERKPRQLTVKCLVGPYKGYSAFQ